MSTEEKPVDRRLVTHLLMQVLGELDMMPGQLRRLAGGEVLGEPRCDIELHVSGMAKRLTGHVQMDAADISARIERAVANAVREFDFDKRVQELAEREMDKALAEAVRHAVLRWEGGITHHLEEAALAELKRRAGAKKK